MGSTETPTRPAEEERRSGGYTVEEYAQREAPFYAAANGVSEEDAREHIRGFMSAFLSLTLEQDKDFEFPYGSGIVFRKTAPDRFVVTMQPPQPGFERRLAQYRRHGGTHSQR